MKIFETTILITFLLSSTFSSLLAAQGDFDFKESRRKKILIDQRKSGKQPCLKKRHSNYQYLQDTPKFPELLKHSVDLSRLLKVQAQRN